LKLERKQFLKKNIHPLFVEEISHYIINTMLPSGLVKKNKILR